MDTNKLKFTRLQSEIFRFLCENIGNDLNQSLIAKSLGVSSTAIAKAIIPMEKSKLVVVSKNKLMNLNLIELNRENSLAVHLKRVDNIKAIYESEILEELEEAFPGCSIILFGSYSKGEDTAKSDIDLAIVGSKEKQIDLSRFERFLKKEIVINFYPSFREIQKELRESMCNGIVLSGGIEL
jgi:predicted nucleotidyltransferase